MPVLFNPSYQTQNTKPDTPSWLNFAANIIIIALTVRLVELSTRNVQLNTATLEINTKNAANNKRNSENGDRTVELLEQINNKIERKQ